MIKKFLVLLLLFSFNLYANDKNSTLSKAKIENKKILVYATSKHCFYCKKMDAEVLSFDEIKEKISKNFVYLKIDTQENELPFNLQKEYKRITPTFFFLDKNGKFLKQYPGSWTKEDFIQILKENIDE